MKEQIYDEQIAPLMAQIIAVCKEAKIAMVANFRIPSDDNPDLHCTTALLVDEYEPSDSQVAALRVLTDSQISAMFLTVKDKEGQVKSVEAILG